ncbi:hypothetical protein MKW98_019845, partial [Papaver atlanticum]
GGRYFSYCKMGGWMLLRGYDIPNRSGYDNEGERGANAMLAVSTVLPVPTFTEKLPVAANSETHLRQCKQALRAIII